MSTVVIQCLQVAINPERYIQVQLPIEDSPIFRFNIQEILQCCKRQAKAMTLITDECSSLLDCHIGGLMASLMAEFSGGSKLSIDRLEIYIDCFCYLLKGDGFTDDEIEKMRVSVTQTVREIISQP